MILTIVIAIITFALGVAVGWFLFLVWCVKTLKDGTGRKNIAGIISGEDSQQGGSKKD